MKHGVFSSVGQNKGSVAPLAASIVLLLAAGLAEGSAAGVAVDTAEVHEAPVLLFGMSSGAVVVVPCAGVDGGPGCEEARQAYYLLGSELPLDARLPRRGEARLVVKEGLVVLTFLRSGAQLVLAPASADEEPLLALVAAERQAAVGGRTAPVVLLRGIGVGRVEGRWSVRRAEEEGVPGSAPNEVCNDAGDCIDFQDWGSSGAGGSSCTAGGPGSTACSITCVRGGACQVTCATGHYACCSCDGGTNCTCVRQQP